MFAIKTEGSGGAARGRNCCHGICRAVVRQAPSDARTFHIEFVEYSQPPASLPFLRPATEDRQDACKESRQRSRYTSTVLLTPCNHTVPQVFPHQAEAGQGPEAEPSHPSVDPSAHQQHHQVRMTQVPSPKERNGKSLDNQYTRWKNANEHPEKHRTLLIRPNIPTTT